MEIFINLFWNIFWVVCVLSFIYVLIKILKLSNIIESIGCFLIFIGLSIRETEKNHYKDIVDSLYGKNDDIMKEIECILNDDVGSEKKAKSIDAIRRVLHANRSLLESLRKKSGEDLPPWKSLTLKEKIKRLKETKEILLGYFAFKQFFKGIEGVQKELAKELVNNPNSILNKKSQSETTNISLNDIDKNI